MITISNSEINTWQRCRRKWLVQYYLGYQPDAEEVTGSRILGVRVHTAMQGYYGYQLDPLAVLHLLYQFELEASPEYERELLAERDLASAMIEGYLEWAAETGVDAGIRVVDTERDVTAALPWVEGVQIRGKLDQVTYDEQTGLLSFLDWKTSASFERHEILALDPQFRFYSLLQQLAAGDPPDDMLGNPVPAAVALVSGGTMITMRRVKRTDRSKPPYFQRDTFRYDPETISSTLKKVQRVAYEIRKARQALDWVYSPEGGKSDLVTLDDVQRSLFPPTPILNQCKFDCPLITLCPMMDDGSDWAGALTRSGGFKQEDPYQYYQDDSLQRVRAALAAQ